jgi:predicted AAA+ superfamily ATPase
MIPRAIAPEFHRLLEEYPVVTILGPRQAGKTTLARHELPDVPYSNLESPEVRAFAAEDPKAFLGQFPDRVIIDEIQRVPELLSYIQTIVDEEGRSGRFVLTGSHQPQVRAAVSQSLAGRVALLHLLPLSIRELRAAGTTFPSFTDYAYRGFLPRIYDRKLRPSACYSNYLQTYVERDVRQFVQLKNASLFEKFIKLLAGRCGQILEVSSLAADTGVDAKTARNWLAVLEASFVIFKLPSYHENFGKRVIKAPKYYFTEVGLLSFILGLREPSQVARDPLVGQIFENLVVIECLKARYNRGEMPDLHFFRDSNRQEVDLVSPVGGGLLAAEIKTSSTFNTSLLAGLRRFRDLTGRKKCRPVLIYNGQPLTTSDGTTAIHFADCAELFD